MNQSCKQYRARLRRNLRCSGAEQKRLLTEFDGMLGKVLEDNPDPDSNALCAALGSPEELAAELMQDISARAVSKWETQQRLVKAALCLVIILLAAVCALIIRFKMHPVQIDVIETTTIYEPETYSEYIERNRGEHE